MPQRSVVVLGGGVAGLATALLLARDGHRVTLVERDDLDVTEPLEAPGWSRRGIPHFLQPHAFIARGRSELMRHLPDVYDELLAAGAQVVDLCRNVAADDRRPGDDELRYLGVRRPLIEWALRRCVCREPGIRLSAGSRATGLRLAGGRAVAAEVDGSEIPADVVVDALGRRAPTAGWLQAGGVAAPPPQTSDCGVVYYCRYYRVRDGFELPDGPWWLSPRGDLGYLGYATFPGDNGTFSALLAVPNGVPEWKALHDAATFERAVAEIPQLRAWVDPDGVDPITEVMPMAGLRNSLRDADAAVAAGVLPVGDALGHTDPVLAHGLAFALIHAAALTASLREHADPRDAGRSYLAGVTPLLRERFEFATALDGQRHRMWTGEPVDFAHADGDYALFSLVAAGAVATVDAEVRRAVLRRLALLDSTSVLDDDRALQQRIEQRFAELAATPPARSGPSREEMTSLVSAHG